MAATTTMGGFFPEVTFPRLDTILALTFVLNMVDALFTITWIECGAAVEANPIMAYFFAVSPSLFAVVKMAMVGTGLAVLWAGKAKTLAKVGAVGVCLVYVAIVAYHLSYVAYLA